MSKLSIKNISKSFNKVQVLKSVSFNLEDGEIVAFLGNSGCGKSTLLRIIAGFETVNSGSLKMNKKNIISTASHKRNIGMFFQNYALFPHLNVEDNIAYGLTPLQKDRVKELIQICKLEGEEKKLIHQISGGQQQRVALARALAPKPQILLLDEPFSNIDSVLKDQLREELKLMIKSSGVSAIFVSHDIEDAFAIADKALILHDGVIQQYDTPENLYRFPENKFVAQFMGDAHIIEGKIESNELLSGDGLNFKLTSKHSNKTNALYAVRMEDFIPLKDPNGDFVVSKIEFKRHYKVLTLTNGHSIKVYIDKDSKIELDEYFSLSIKTLQPLS